MAVGGEGPSVETALLDPSVGWNPGANSRSQVGNLGARIGPLGGQLWRKMVNVEVRDGGMQFRPAIRRRTGYAHDGAQEPPWNKPFISDGYGPVPVQELLEIPVWGDSGATTVASTLIRLAVSEGGVARQVGTNAWTHTHVLLGGGTVTFNAASTTVTGSGTLWATNGVGFGDQIILDNGVTAEWHIVASVASETSMTLASAPSHSGAGVAYTVRKRWITSLWQYGQGGLHTALLNGDLYVAGLISGNPIRPAVVRFPDVLDIDPAGFFGTFDVLYAHHQLDGTSHDTNSNLLMVNGLQALPDGRIVIATVETPARVSRIRYSSNVDQAEWSAAPAGFTDDVSGGKGGVRALGSLGRTLTVHYEDGISLGILTDNVNEPLRFEGTRESRGCPGGQLLQTYNGAEYFLTLDGTLQRFNGATLERISDALRLEAIAVGLERVYQFNSVFDEAREEYVAFENAVGVGAEASYGINVRTGAVRKEDYPLVVQTQHRRGMFLNARTSRVGAVTPTATSDGVFDFVEGRGSDDNAGGWSFSSIEVRAETFPLDFGQPSVRKVIDRVIVWVRNHRGNLDTDTSYPLSVSIHANGDNTATQTVAKTINVPTDENEEAENQFVFRTDRSAESWVVRLEFTDDKLVGQISRIAIRHAALGETEAS